MSEIQYKTKAAAEKHLGKAVARDPNLKKHYRIEKVSFYIIKYIGK